MSEHLYEGKTDHDLIVELNTNMKLLLKHVRTMNGNVAKNTRWRLILTGAWGFLIIAVPILIKIMGS